MQIKHTFLFTFVLGLVWTGYLFAYVLGPDPGQNGVFGNATTCATSGCHTGAPLNAPGGSVTLSGLPPEGWLPGQTYPLTVTIQRAGQRLFGFQLSAVTDSGNQQAGTLVAGSRVAIVCGNSQNRQVTCSTPGAIQFAQHSNAQVVTSTYSVNWTAPSSATVGRVRFNVAGNAANGDITNQGDFIYTTAPTVDAASAPAGESTRAFSINDRGGASLSTDGGGDLTVGYARIQPDAGRTTPTGVAIFGYRVNNVLVTEAGVPASPLITAGRIYAEVGGPVNTGLAIANPNDTPANIMFNFTGATGDFGVGTTTIPANQQLARFLFEPDSPYNGPSTLQGTFSFTSNVPVSVIALRGFTNDRGDFLITTLPVTDLSAPTSTEPPVLSHFADGFGWTTQIVLVNPSDTAITGSIQFFSQGAGATAGVPLTIAASAQGAAVQTSNSFTYSIPGKSSFKLLTAGTSGAASVPASGSVRITPGAASVAPTALVIFSYKVGAVTVSEAGVPAMRGNAFRMYVEGTGSGSAVGTIQSGLAISNLSATAATVNLELFNLNGTTTGMSTPVTIPANGQTARFVHELFPVTFPFQGILRISGGIGGGLSVVGLRLRYNERNEFLMTTTPPSNEGGTASPAELAFPHIVNGGGFTTQFILFSGTTGQASNGNLRFLRRDGTAYNLTLN